MEEKDTIPNLYCLKNAMPLKVFVQAKGESLSVTGSTKLNLVSGAAVKETYIDIVGNESILSSSEKGVGCKKFSNNESNKKKIAASKNQDLNANKIMKAVEMNDTSKLSEFLDIDKDFVLNVKDQYGWTAMMSACCAGAEDVIKLLLRFNPNLNISDKTGNTCLKLAQSKGHKLVVNLINDYLKSSRNDKSDFSNINVNLPTKSTSFYCETCKETVNESEQSHLTSTVHLFNTSRKSGVRTAYGIPEHNVGFQMLLKTGWDREKGLGPEGSGHKFPPKTMLKQDRAGLGAKKYTSRITHDPHLVVKDRTERQKTLNRRERLRNEIKSKRKERDLRRALD